MAIGSVTLYMPDGTTTAVAYANLRAVDATYDRTMFRAPYGEDWFTAGTGKREPERFTLSCEVWAATIEDAAPAVTALLADLNNAVVVSGALGHFVNAGVMSYSQSPIAGGYRLDVTLLAHSGRYAGAVSGITYDAHAASNGTVTTNDGDRYTMVWHTFTSDGWFYVFDATSMNRFGAAGLMVVGGGGGGGGYYGGGGGAGGVYLATGFEFTNGYYHVALGSGGAGGTANGGDGANGTATTVFGPLSVTAPGGGGGGGAGNAGTAGGSGGGAGATGSDGGAGTSGFGYAGGAANDQAGGGGGASEAGAAGGASYPGDGGDGRRIDALYGTYFGGGGGGGGGLNGSGGVGGGGAGAAGSNTPTAGAANTGGGGGGSGSSTSVAGAQGGSGVVVFRYGRSLS